MTMQTPRMSIKDVIVEPPAEDVVVDPVDWFASPGPVELEIGCGKGGFLLSRARAKPELRLVGVEWANKFYKYAADRMARWGLTNVRVMRTDASQLVRAHLAPACLTALHVYHPDPWPKTRHQKRRLVQPAFVESAVRALKPGGRWAVQTDHAEYFEQIQACIVDHPQLVETPFEDDSFGIVTDGANTNFEIKYRREGRPIYNLAVVKRG